MRSHVLGCEDGRLRFPRRALVLAVAAIVSLFTVPKPEAEIASLIWNKESLQLPPAIREKSRGLRSPALWWAIV